MPLSIPHTSPLRKSKQAAETALHDQHHECGCRVAPGVRFPPLCGTRQLPFFCTPHRAIFCILYDRVQAIPKILSLSIDNPVCDLVQLSQGMVPHQFHGRTIA